MRNHKLKALGLAMILLAGCNGTGNHSSGSHNQGISSSQSEGTVYLDQLGVVPVKNGYKSTYILRVNNDSKENYTLKSVKATDISGVKDLSKIVKLVASVGKVIPANGSSSIQFSPQITTSGDVLLTVLLETSTGKTETLHQLIRISDKVGSTSGVGAVNDIHQINSKSGSYSMALPIVLTEDFDTVSAKNGSVLCSAAGFKKGNSCTLLIKGNAIADHTVVNTRVSAYRKGKEVAYSDGNVAIERASAANLLISHGVSIKADGKETQSISIFNAGNAPATALELADLGNLSLSKSHSDKPGCAFSGVRLMENQGCSYFVNASAEVNGNQPFTVKYNGGDVKQVSTNVSYRADKPQIAFELDSQTGDLANTLINDGGSQVILSFRNNSNRNLYNLKFLPAASAEGFSFLHNECSGDKDKQICTIMLIYNPKTETGSTIRNLNLNVSAMYKSVDGLDKQYLTNFVIPYSAVLAKNILTISSNNANNLNTIIGVAAKADFTVHNNAKMITTPITDISLSNSVAGLTLDLSGCKNGNAFKSLPASENCSITANYAAQSQLQAKVENNIRASYMVNNTPTIANSDKFDVAVNTGDRAFITTDITTSSPPKTLGGNGFSNLPYQFMALTNNRLRLKYVFTNRGMQDATKFNISGIPPEAQLGTSDCGVGTEMVTIAAGGSCSIELTIPNDAFFNQEASFEKDELLMAGFSLPVSYTYSDNAGTKASKDQLDSIKRYVNFNRQWANIILDEQFTRLDTSDVNDKYWEVNYKVNVNVATEALNSGLVSYPLKITPVLEQHNLNNAATFTSCTIVDATVAQECSISAKFPLNQFGENSIKLDLVVSGNGIEADSNDKLHYPVLANLTANPLEVKVSKGLAVNTKGIVPYSLYKDQVIYADMESYPFELVISKPNGDGGKIFSDIKLSDVSLLPSGYKISLDTSNCNQDKAFAGNTECTVKGSLQIALSQVANWRVLESQTLNIILQYHIVDPNAQNNATNNSTDPVKLKVVNGVLVSSSSSLETIRFNGDTSSMSFHVINPQTSGLPENIDTGVYIAPNRNAIVSGEDKNVGNTINIKVIDQNGQDHALSLFVIRSNEGGSLRPIWNALPSEAYRSSLHMSTGYGGLGYVFKFYNYEGTEYINHSHVLTLNGKLPAGNYKGFFYVYGVNYDSTTNPSVRKVNFTYDHVVKP